MQNNLVYINDLIKYLEGKGWTKLMLKVYRPLNQKLIITECEAQFAANWNPVSLYEEGKTDIVIYYRSSFSTAYKEEKRLKNKSSTETESQQTQRRK